MMTKMLGGLIVAIGLLTSVNAFSCTNGDTCTYQSCQTTVGVQTCEEVAGVCSNGKCEG